MRNQIHFYAVVRVDVGRLGKCLASGRPDLGITVKEVVRSEAEAIAEVKRLSEVNKDKNCVYFLQTARMRRDEAETSNPI